MEVGRLEVAAGHICAGGHHETAHQLRGTSRQCWLRLVLRIEQCERSQFVDLNPGLTPPFRNTVIDACAWLRWPESLIELQNVLPQCVVHMLEVAVGQSIQ